MPDTKPTMTPVTSSNLHSVGRCADGHLWVRFKGAGGIAGKLYRYDGAAATHHQALLDAASPGSYFARMIKGHHNGSHIDG